MALFNKTKLRDQTLLEDIQGNILRGYGGVKTLYCFVRFGEDDKAARIWLDKHVSGAGAKLPVTAALKHTASMEQPLVGFMLTVSGLRRLGCSEKFIEKMDASFRLGSRNETIRKKLNDTVAATQWEKAYKSEWDALWLVNCTAAQEDAVKTALLAATANGLAAAHIEDGAALGRDGAPLGDGESSSERHEAFGYRDNVSQLFFSEEHAEQHQQPEKPKWDSRREVSVVLAADPMSPEGKSFGSYFVFRKLEQNVQEFRKRVQKYAESLSAPLPHTERTRGQFLSELYGNQPAGAFGLFANKASPAAPEVEKFVKARIMGRHPDGTALTPPTNPDPAQHAFDYSDDRAGDICPFHAHIRKMNPRGSTGDADDEKDRSIARRGIPYGRSDAGAQGPCGLLFLCAQSDITEQFEFHQANWGNAGKVDLEAEPTPGPDNVGAQPETVPDKLQTYGDKLNRYDRYKRTIDADVRIWDLVKLCGAEYLFAPSLSGLQALAQGDLQ